MSNFFGIFFLTSYLGLIIFCAIRIFLKIRKSIQKQELKKSFKIIKGGKK
jgi:hypothetical protein